MIDLQDYTDWTRNTCADIGTQVMDTIHMLMGMTTEVGELTDVFKKHIAYDKKVDWVNVEEELGDLMYYIARFCGINSINLEEVIHKNVRKLEARYPNNFTKENALNRNLKKEREILED